MRRAERLCKNVNKDIRPQVITLAEGVLAMQRKIQQQIPVYEDMPLAQEVTVGTGEKMMRQNPAATEFRALIREYAAGISALQALINDNKITEIKEPVSIIGRSKWKKAVSE